MNVFEDLKAKLNRVIDEESKKCNPAFEDLVKVVRCKGCKYFKRGDEYAIHYGRCELLMTDMNDCDYCSYGTREEN